MTSEPPRFIPRSRIGDTVERTAEILKARILEGSLAPGQRLISQDLMDELSVSRGSLREAFHLLASDRLVDLIPNRGAIVRRLTADDVIHLFQIREALEGQAARLAAELIDSSGARASFAALAEEGRQYSGQADLAGFIPYNRRFHQAIVAMSGNTELAELIDRYQLAVFMHLLHRSVGTRRLVQESVDHHDAIAEAILSGDGEAAESAMRAHLRHSAEGIVERLAAGAGGLSRR